MKSMFLCLMLLISFAANAQLLDSLSLENLDAYTNLDSALKEPDKVIKLVLRKEKLKEFPKEIFQLKRLQYLDLGKNKLSEIPADIYLLDSLQMLLLSKNEIEYLPKEIGKLSNLFLLNINQNDLIALPAQIGKLKNLQYLDLWSNELSEFPESLQELKKLRVLDLRVILIDDPQQKHIQALLPNTQIFFSPSCNCGH